MGTRVAHKDNEISDVFVEIVDLACGLHTEVAAIVVVVVVVFLSVVVICFVCAISLFGVIFSLLSLSL